MKSIPLTQGMVAVVDDEDYGNLALHSWRASKGRRTYYAKADIAGKTVYMHRFIKPEIGGGIDHVDGNGLNNQRTNLRGSTPTQNAQNCKKYKNGHSSQYKGVIWEKTTGKWRANIKANGKRLSLGRFASESEAARAYDTAARSHFGKFAKLNLTPLDREFE